jgi:hypothetical protein
MPRIGLKPASARWRTSFVGSKAPWYDLSDDGLPRYAEYPGTA